MIARITLACLLLATPALAQSDGGCRGSARDVERELALRGNTMSAADRLQAEQRLSRTEGLCNQDAPRAGQDLEQLRRDIIQQATRPPGLPGPGAPDFGPDRY